MQDQDHMAALVLREMGMAISDLGSFDGRRTLQKVVYLLQEGPGHWDLGFHFSLYIRGPYSRDLADAGYRLLRDPQQLEEVAQRLTLNVECRRHIEQLREVFSEGPEKLDVDLLELVATLHFLLVRSFSYETNPQARIDQARSWIDERKPQLAPRSPEALKALSGLQMMPAR